MLRARLENINGTLRTEWQEQNNHHKSVRLEGAPRRLTRLSIKLEQYGCNQNDNDKENALESWVNAQLLLLLWLNGRGAVGPNI